MTSVQGFHMLYNPKVNEYKDKEYKYKEKFCSFK